MSNTVKWEIEEKCNLNCTHCFVGKTNYGSSLSLEESKKVIDYVIEMNVTDIMFSSKEPFFYKNFLNLIKYCRLKGLNISIVTNGTLFTERIIEELSRANIKAVSISLEGISPQTNDYIRGNGVFDKVITGVELINKANKDHKKMIPLVLQLTLTEKNKNEVGEMIGYFNDTSFVTINLGDIALTGNAKDNLDLKLSDCDYDKSVEVLLKQYSSLKNKNFLLNFKKAVPYEIVYYNTIFNLDLDLVIPNCSIYDGGYSLLPDGTICSCVVLIEEENLSIDKKDIFFNKILSVNQDQTKDYQIKTSEKFKKYKSYKSEIRLCRSCHFKELCNLCLIISANKENLHYFIERCQYFRDKIDFLFNEIINSRISFQFKKNVFLKKVSGDLEVHILYKANNNKTIKITNSEHIETLIKIYKDSNWVFLKDILPVENFKETLTYIMINDGLSVNFNMGDYRTYEEGI